MELSEILDLTDPVYAHTGSRVYAEKETLQEHTVRCQKYFERLLDKEKMLDSLGRMEPVLTGNTDRKYADWFWQALRDVITFHDTGKVNPLFQRDAMGNEAFAGIDIPYFHDKKHAALSSYMYLDYQASKLEQLDREMRIAVDTKIYLYEIVCMNAYLIMKHHSDLDCFDEFVTAIQPNGKLNNIDLQVQKKSYQRLYRGKYSRMPIENYGRILKMAKKGTQERSFVKYIYTRLLFSLLTASDYYATNEYVNGAEIQYFGSVKEMADLKEAYEKTERMQSIRAFCPETAIDDGRDINYLRNMLFHEAEESLKRYDGEDIFYLEAPTGCGKSNVGFNCSFALARQDMGRIFYVYPFNNLVEQNKAVLEELFQGQNIFEKAAVVNSITPIKRDQKFAGNEEEYEQDWGECNWSKSLLDRQFLNYPIILTTHVNLFQTMFSTEREAVFGFHQLTGSVIVLDEIQSYKNAIWTEIMMSLQYYCRYMNCKVLIMSATLPDLAVLTGKHERVCRLIQNRTVYFNDPRFQNRVDVSYELLNDSDFDEERLYEHVKRQANTKKKILIEFIQKDMAYRFFDRLAADAEIGAVIERMTGDDNIVDRERILRHIKSRNFERSGYILVATQVIEAGVDIDMDIGYKDISTLDSEEQFMGRINRNNHKDGIVYYFDLYPAKHIYGKDDYRISEELTLRNVCMQQVLKEKRFSDYYSQVMEVIRKNRNESSDAMGITAFADEIGSLNYMKVKKRMQLIEEDDWSMSVFLARTITLPDGGMIDGKELWNQYKSILTRPPEDYAKFRIQLSEITSRLNLFIYQIKKTSNITYSDRIGEIYCIMNGEDFFVEGRLDKKKLEEAGGLFIEI